MLYEIFGDVFRWARDSAGITKTEMARSLGRTRQVVGRWESGAVLPPPEAEERFLALANCSRRRFAELACKRISQLIGMRMAILPEASAHYQPSTPLAQAEELLAANHARLHPRLRRAPLRRVRRARTLSFVIEQDLLETVEEIEACLEALDEERGEE